MHMICDELVELDVVTNVLITNDLTRTLIFARDFGIKDQNTGREHCMLDQENETKTTNIEKRERQNTNTRKEKEKQLENRTRKKANIGGSDAVYISSL